MIITIVLVLFVSFIVFAIFEGGIENIEDLILYLLIFIGLVVLAIWNSSFKVVFEADRMVYRSLFTQPKEMVYTAIHKIETTFKLRDRHGFYLNLYEADNSLLMTINLGLFDKKAIRALLNLLTKTVPTAEIDELTSELRRGNFNQHAIHFLTTFLGGFLKK